MMVLLPYLMSLLLGRTIDLTSYMLGGDIYDATRYNEHSLMTENKTYRILQENEFPYTQLGFPVDLSIRIKSHSLATPSGSIVLEGLLKVLAPKPNRVAIVLVSKVKTIKRELQKDAPLIADWTSRIEDSQSHYVHSLTYGGWRIVIYKFMCAIPADADRVRKTLTDSLGVVGNIDEHTVELFKRVIHEAKNNKDLSGKVSAQIHVYSSVPHGSEITLDNFMDILTKIKDDVGPVGRPLSTELRPLHDLDSRYPVLTASHDLDSDLEDFDFMFDDLRATKNELNKWLMESLTEFTDKEEKRITNFMDYVSRCTRAFYELASEVSIYKPMDKKFIRLAFAMYNRGLRKNPGTYKQLLTRLREDLDPECEDSFSYPIKGVLKTTRKERKDIGEVGGELQKCMGLCIEEERCRAIGYASTLTTRRGDTKRRQCVLYFRSTRTAQVIAASNGTDHYIYDRECLV